MLRTMQTRTMQTMVPLAQPGCPHYMPRAARWLSQTPPVLKGLSQQHRSSTSRKQASRSRLSCRAQQQDVDISSKNLKETAALDQLIDLLLSAKSKEELGKLVAENIISFDQKFWLRIAARNDTAATQEEKQRLQSLANAVMTLVDAIVKTSQGQLKQSSSVLQEIMTAAADERGEWLVPLTSQQLESMSQEGLTKCEQLQAMDRHKDELNESLLANAYAWMRKAHGDKMDGMVALLQQVLQLYAAKVLVTPDAEGADEVLNQIIAAPEAEWTDIIKQRAADGQLQQEPAMAALQKRMEGVVLGQSSGSYAQRVQAEYLKEVEDRVKSVLEDSSEVPGTKELLIYESTSILSIED